MISLWALLKEAFGDLFELDSRLWRTLLPLALKPGRLTRDYLNGRRARYMPPFRMYLVLSLAFFVIAFFDPQKDLGILFAEELPETITEPAAARQAAPDAEDDDPGAESATALANGDINLQVDFGDGMDEVENCQMEDYDVSEAPEWVARRFTKARVQAACRNIIGDGTDSSGWQPFVDGMVENMPAGLFVLLPLDGARPESPLPAIASLLRGTPPVRYSLPLLRISAAYAGDSAEPKLPAAEPPGRPGRASWASRLESISRSICIAHCGTSMPSDTCSRYPSFSY